MSGILEPAGSDITGWDLPATVSWARYSDFAGNHLRERGASNRTGDIPAEHLASNSSWPPSRSSGSPAWARFVARIGELPGSRDRVVVRLRELYDITSDDPDEPSMDLSALTSLVRFLCATGVRDPDLAASDGRILAQWDDSEVGLLAFEFREDGNVEFALASGDGSVEPIRIRLRGGPELAERCLGSVRTLTGGFP